MLSKLVFNDFELNPENFINGVTYKNSVNAERDLYFRTVAMSEIKFSVLESTLSETAKTGLVDGAECEFYYKSGNQRLQVTNIIQNGDFANSTNWSGYFTVANKVGTGTQFIQAVALQAHKYYLSFSVDDFSELAQEIEVILGQSYGDYVSISKGWQRVSLIIDATGFINNNLEISTEYTSIEDFNLKEVMLIDLTEISMQDKTVSELEDIFANYFSGTKTIIDEELGYVKGNTYTIKDIKKTGGRLNVTAYDDMYKFDVDVSEWVNSLSYPRALITMFTSLCNYLNVSGLGLDRPNMYRLLEENALSEGITGRIVLQYIAELTNSIIYIDNERRVVLSYYQEKEVTIDNSKYIKFTKADYRTAKIDKVQIKSTLHDIGVIVGTGENALIVHENPLAAGESDLAIRPIAQAIYDNIKEFDYYPFEIEMLEDCGINVGDIITINGEKTIVMEKIMKPSGVVLSATGEKTRNTQTSQTNYEFIRLRGMAHDIINTVDTFESRISTAEGNVTTLTQTVNGFSGTISDAEDNIATLTATVNGFSSRITTAEGNVTTLTTTVNGFDSRITTVEGYNSRITQTESNIALVVGSGKLVGSGGAVNASVVVSAINGGTATISASRISLTGKTINLTSDDITITSNNFQVDKNGNITAQNATLSGTSNLILGEVTGYYRTRESYISGTRDFRMVFYHVNDPEIAMPFIATAIDNQGTAWFSKMMIFEPYADNLNSRGELSYDFVNDAVHLMSNSTSKLKISSATNMSIDSTKSGGIVHIATSENYPLPQEVIIGTNTGKIFLKGQVYINNTLLPY